VRAPAQEPPTGGTPTSPPRQEPPLAPRGPPCGPDGGPAVDTQGDRFLEIWTLVFDEFLRGEGKGHDFELLGKLDQTAIDTGAGLERLAFIMQDKPNMYEIDEVFPVIKAAEELSGKVYGRGSAGPEAGEAHHDDVRMRVVADHVRSALMLISDGVRPGNDGRGYVLRRLIRRAVRSMRLLGADAAACSGAEPPWPAAAAVPWSVEPPPTEMEQALMPVRDRATRTTAAARRGRRGRVVGDMVLLRYSDVVRAVGWASCTCGPMAGRRFRRPGRRPRRGG